MSYLQTKRYERPFEKNLLLLTTIIQKCTAKHSYAFSEHKKIILLYTIIQNVLPFSKILTIETFERFAESNQLSLEDYTQFFYQKSNTGDPLKISLGIQKLTTWNQFLMLNFVILETLIIRRTNKTFHFQAKIRNVGSPMINQGPENPLKNRFAPFLVVGFNKVRSAIKEIAKGVIDHNFSLLFAVFVQNCFDPKCLLKKEILTNSLLMPYDDDQIVKSHCAMELYRCGEHLKSYQLIQQYLEKEKPNDKAMHAILALGSIVGGRYLDRLEVHNSNVFLFMCYMYGIGKFILREIKY